MALAPSVERYLIRRGIGRGVMSHAPTAFSMATAYAAGVPARRLVKGVVLRDDRGYILAVVPADHRE